MSILIWVQTVCIGYIKYHIVKHLDPDQDRQCFNFVLIFINSNHPFRNSLQCNWGFNLLFKIYQMLIR